MTNPQISDRDVNRAIRSWLHENRHEDAARVAGAVLDEVEATPERRSTWWPARRMPIMTKSASIGLGAVAVIVLFLLGARLFGSPNGGVGSEPSPTTSPQPSATATARPTSSPTPAPPLTQTFRSTLHGLSMSYPDGWSVQAATEPWTARTFNLEFLVSQADFMYDPSLADHLFLTVASQALGDSAPDAWMNEQMASGEGCSETQSIVVDGAAGLIGTGDCPNVAVVTTGGRGYWIELLTSGDQPWLATIYDRAWFEQVLATVQLHPKKAVDKQP